MRAHLLGPGIAVALMALALSAPARSSAQGRELASPWGSSSSPAAPELPLEGEAVPPPPGSYDANGLGDVRVVEPGDAPPADVGAGTAWTAAEPGSSLRIRSSISTRLRSLDADLQVLAARGGGGIVDGILAIAMGATSVGIGIFMDVSGSAGGSPITPYLYLYGGSGIVRGILDFIFIPNPSGAAITYAQMPMGNLGEVGARLRYGERELESLAQTAEIARILDGALSIATGLAVVPVYLGPNNFRVESAFDYFVLIGAAVSATTGIITLFTTNEAERRWGAYRELRERLLATEQGAADDAELEQAREQLEAFERSAVEGQIRPVLAGTQGGLFAGASGTF